MFLELESLTNQRGGFKCVTACKNPERTQAKEPSQCSHCHNLHVPKFTRGLDSTWDSLPQLPEATGKITRGRHADEMTQIKTQSMKQGSDGSLVESQNVSDSISPKGISVLRTNNNVDSSGKVCSITCLFIHQTWLQYLSYGRYWARWSLRYQEIKWGLCLGSRVIRAEQCGEREETTSQPGITTGGG